MSELLSQLGINGKLLLAQAVNFGVVLVVLTFVVYRPLARLMEERRRKIELGLHSAEIAEARLLEIEEERKHTIAEAEHNAINIIADAERRGTENASEILRDAEKKSNESLEAAIRIAEHRKQEELNKLSLETAGIMKDAIMKAVELDPKHADEKLITRASDIMKKRIASL